jgi:hypothetical protein
MPTACEENSRGGFGLVCPSVRCDVTRSKPEKMPRNRSPSIRDRDLNKRIMIHNGAGGIPSPLLGCSCYRQVLRYAILRITFILATRESHPSQTTLSALSENAPRTLVPLVPQPSLDVSCSLSEIRSRWQSKPCLSSPDNELEGRTCVEVPCSLR